MVPGPQSVPIRSVSLSSQATSCLASGETKPPSTNLPGQAVEFAHLDGVLAAIGQRHQAEVSSGGRQSAPFQTQFGLGLGEGVEVQERLPARLSGAIALQAGRAPDSAHVVASCQKSRKVPSPSKATAGMRSLRSRWSGRHRKAARSGGRPAARQGTGVLGAGEVQSAGRPRFRRDRRKGRVRGLGRWRWFL